ncbi:hypothetical protein Tco_1266938, partial [Tanacetum coccineum]
SLLCKEMSDLPSDDHNQTPLLKGSASEELISNVNYPPVDEGHQQKNDSTIPSEGLNTGPKKVNDLVNEDSDSEEDEQWKETYEDDPYDDADFDSLGLLEDQMTYPKLDICL